MVVFHHRFLIVLTALFACATSQLILSGGNNQEKSKENQEKSKENYENENLFQQTAQNYTSALQRNPKDSASKNNLDLLFRRREGCLSKWFCALGNRISATNFELTSQKINFPLNGYNLETKALDRLEKAEQINKTLEYKFENLKQRVTVNDLKQEQEKIEATLQSLSDKQLAELKRTKSNIKKDTQNLTTDIENIQQRISTLNQTIEEKKKAFEQTEKKLKTLKKQTKNLKATCIECNQKESTLQTDLIKINKEIEAQSHQVREVENTIKRLENDIKQKQREIQNHTENSETKQKELNQILQKLKEATQNKAQLETSLANLQDQQNTLENNNQKIKEDIKTKEKEQKNFEAEPQRLQSHLKKSQSSKNVLDEGYTFLTQSIDAKNKKIDDLTQNIETPRKKIEELKNEIVTSKSQVNQKKKSKKKTPKQTPQSSVHTTQQLLERAHIQAALIKTVGTPIVKDILDAYKLRGVRFKEFQIMDNHAIAQLLTTAASGFINHDHTTTAATALFAIEKALFRFFCQRAGISPEKYMMRFPGSRGVQINLITNFGIAANRWALNGGSLVDNLKPGIQIVLNA